MLNSIHKMIESRILNAPEGSVFVPGDFSDITTATTASKSLVRLNKNGVLRKLMRGVFWKGSVSEPDPDTVAHALARSNCRLLAPCGDTALHLFGLSETVPRIWTYITDGTYCSYVYGNTEIRFRHASGRFLSRMSEKTATLVQVLKAMGENRLNDTVLKKIASRLNRKEISAIHRECARTTAWVYSAICRMIKLKEE